MFSSMSTPSNACAVSRTPAGRRGRPRREGHRTSPLRPRSPAPLRWPRCTPITPRKVQRTGRRLLPAALCCRMLGFFCRRSSFALRELADVYIFVHPSSHVKFTPREYHLHTHAPLAPPTRQNCKITEREREREQWQKTSNGNRETAREPCRPFSSPSFPLPLP